MLTRGLFIAFEGIDGSGKSTQARQLYNNLKKTGYKVLLTREPSDSLWGKKIREMASSDSYALTPEEELALFIKDRYEHVSKVIAPALAKKEIVITDRYYFSTIAYQGAKGIDQERIRDAHKNLPVPDLVFYLALTPENGLARIQQYRSGKLTSFEKKDYLKKVKILFDSFDDPCFLKINGSLPLDQTSKIIGREMEKLLSRHEN